MTKYKIQRYSTTLTIPAEGTSIVSSAIGLNGKLKGILLDVPALVGTTTITITIKDVGSYTIFTKASIAENAKTTTFIDTNNFPLELPLSGNHTITLTATNAQTGASADIGVVLLIERK